MIAAVGNHQPTSTLNLCWQHTVVEARSTSLTPLPDRIGMLVPKLRIQAPPDLGATAFRDMRACTTPNACTTVLTIEVRESPM